MAYKAQNILLRISIYKFINFLPPKCLMNSFPFRKMLQQLESGRRELLGRVMEMCFFSLLLEIYPLRAKDENINEEIENTTITMKSRVDPSFVVLSQS